MGNIVMMTDLSEVLRGSEGEKIKKKLNQRFYMLQKSIQRKLEAGLPPEKYSNYLKLKEAIDCSINVVEQYTK